MMGIIEKVFFFYSAPPKRQRALENAIRALTCSLQTEAKVIVEAVDEINTVQRALQSVKDEVDVHHSEW